MKVVFDLDGTLANIEHRLHFIHQPKKDWPSFFRACVDDKPIPQTACIYHAMLAAGHTVEIWSGRSDEVWLQTVAWISSHLHAPVPVPSFDPRNLRMRKAGDYRMDAVVKEEWLKGMDAYEWPFIAFDDRQQVVDMWRKNSVLCCQVADGKF